MARLIAIAWLVCCFPFCYSLAFAQEIDKADYYIDAYGRANPTEYPEIDRINRIYKNIVSIAEDRFRGKPNLVIINSPDKPWAVSLPDNSIILTLGVIKICYEGVTLEEGDSRMAFVLAHEIVHLSHHDYWQHEIIKSFAQGDTESLNIAQKLAVRNAGIQSNQLALDEIKAMELRADDMGFLYASLAGYDVWDGLSADKLSFFEIWNTYTGASENTTHYTSDVRQKLIENKLDRMAKQADFAAFGLALSSLGRHEDAISIFEQVVKYYPSPEILNNLAFANIQLAISSIGMENLEFHFPATLEYRQGFDHFEKSITDNKYYQAREYLFRAKDHLEKSLDAAPQYIAALKNLGLVYYYLEDYHFARAMVEKALSISQGDPIIRMMRVLIVYKQEKDIDMWPRTVTTLESLLEDHNMNIIKLNLAKLYGKRGRDQLEEKYYTQLLESGAESVEIIEISCGKIKHPVCEEPRVREHSGLIKIESESPKNGYSSDPMEIVATANGREEFLFINGVKAAVKIYGVSQNQIDCEYTDDTNNLLRLNRCSANTAFRNDDLGMLTVWQSY